MLIYTVGLQGSGKSTWAKGQCAKHGWKQVEMDIVREELGVGGSAWTLEGEKRARTEWESRIRAALKGGQTVVCSDTNLSAKVVRRLEAIARSCGVETQRVSFLDVPLEECILRDAQREPGKRVGEWVIRRTHAQVRPDDDVARDRRHVVVGDVHGQVSKLICLLQRLGFRHDEKWMNSQNIHLVFLGDLNDPRMPTESENVESSSWECINIAQQLMIQGHATVLRSNHQHNLINLFRGRRTKVSDGLEYTQAEMLRLIDQHGRQYIADRIDWLDSLPYYYTFEQGGLYTCVHAEYTPGMRQYNPDKDALQKALYGSNKDGQRHQWWLEPPTDRTVIAGHYHTVFQSANAVILDGGCGQGGQLVALNVETQQLLWI